MSRAYSIRQPRMEGDSIARISRKLEVSRDTVYKYLAMEDLSQRPPAPRAKASVLDRYRPLIESWLDEDERNWRKQRHTARRIWARLRDEAGADVAESTVRNYVRRIDLYRSFGHVCWRSHSPKMHTNDDERTADMANPAARYTDAYRSETADNAVAALESAKSRGYVAGNAIFHSDSNAS